MKQTINIFQNFVTFSCAYIPFAQISMS